MKERISIPERALYLVLSGGLAVVVQIAFDVSYPPAVMIAIAIGVGLAVAIVGPKLLELLLSMF